MAEGVKDMTLSVKKVEKAHKPGRYGDGYGLYLQINATGCKSWVLRFERGGKERMLGLGSYHDISLEEAREKARVLRRDLKAGIDPMPRQTVKAISFETATRQYFELHQSQWRNPVHKRQFISSLEAHAFPHIGELPVNAIDTAAVLRTLELIWVAKPTTASRVRARIEAILSWATVRQLRSGDNPARWGGHLKAALPSKNKVAKVKHHPAMPVHEVPAFMAALATRDGIPARALEFLILTAARTGEVIGARWDEIDMATKVWTVPAERMKAGKEHRVPLSDRAVAILADLPREGQFVFPGQRNGTAIGDQALGHTLKRILGPEAGVTVHGFRSSFRDWASEFTGHSNEVIEMALAHTIKNAVEGAYRRGDLLPKRVPLMQDWERFCTTVKTSAQVVPMRTVS
jgi:integrase